MIIELGKVTEETQATSPVSPFNDNVIYNYPF
jgi:hypothetical protein